MEVVDDFDDNNIRLTSSIEVNAIPSGESKEIIIMASMLAPFFEDTERAPLDLVCVMDRSGSMSGDKLRLCKETLNFTIKQLHSKDRLAVVAYDNEVITPLDLCYMDPRGKELATRAVQKIECGGSTDLCAGLLRGVEIIQKNPTTSGQVSSVLLLTDGCANAGIQKTEDIIAELAKQKDIESCGVHTFGYGGDHEVAMLKGISDYAHGVYYFVENKDQIPEAFGDCIGGLLSVVGQNVFLTVEGISGSKVTQVISGFKTQQSTEGVFSVSLGDVQSEEERDILCKVTIPECEEGNGVPVLRFRLSYFNVLDSKQIDHDLIATVDRPKEVGQLEYNSKIDQQKNRLYTADVISLAKKLADQQQFEKARELVTNASKKIQESISGGEPFCKCLLLDLEECLSGLQDRNKYMTSGTYTMSSKASSHYQQRSTTSTTSYNTSKKAAMRTNFTEK